MSEAGSGEWTELALRVGLPPGVAHGSLSAGAHLAPIEDVLIELFPEGFSLEGPDAPPGDDAPPEEGTVRYRLYVPVHETEATVAAVSSRLVGPHGASLSWRPLDPAWRERWKAWFQGFDVSERLRVRPPWETAEGPDHPCEVVIEPGMAFGTGQHETTRLCLEALDRGFAASEGPRTVLDVGCGTGILGIAALKLGATHVVGIDSDPTAVEHARENAKTNGVAAHISLSTTPLEAVDGPFSWVVANILAHVLGPMASALAARVASGGRLVLSGILAEEAAALSERVVACGLVPLGQDQAGDWVRLDFGWPG